MRSFWILRGHSSACPGPGWFCVCGLTKEGLPGDMDLREWGQGPRVVSMYFY